MRHRIPTSAPARGAAHLGLAPGLFSAPLALAADPTALALAALCGAGLYWYGSRRGRRAERACAKLEETLAAYSIDAGFGLRPDTAGLSDRVTESLDHFDDFRRTEGAQMLDDLRRQCSSIATQVDAVAEQAPNVVAEYRAKLLDRISGAVQESGVSISESDVIREVALFADRCDINEEITRLRSHLQQFHSFLDDEQSLGRKLEFLGQEMFREINTIGSKANNVAIAHNVVEMKAAIERIREVLQNVE